jgi:hypothetical protein
LYENLSKCQVSSAEPGEDQVSYRFPDFSSCLRAGLKILASDSKFKTQVLEDRPRVSTSTVGGRPRFLALADGNKTQVSEFKTRVSVSAVGGRPRVLASADGDKPRVSVSAMGGRPRFSASTDGDKTRVSEFKTRVSASAVGGIYTPHSQKVSFAPRIF